MLSPGINEADVFGVDSEWSVEARNDKLCAYYRLCQGDGASVNQIISVSLEEFMLGNVDFKDEVPWATRPLLSEPVEFERVAIHNARRKFDGELLDFDALRLSIAHFTTEPPSELNHTRPPTRPAHLRHDLNERTLLDPLSHSARALASFTRLSTFGAWTIYPNAQGFTKTMEGLLECDAHGLDMAFAPLILRTCLLKGKTTPHVHTSASKHLGEYVVDVHMHPTTATTSLGFLERGVPHLVVLVSLIVVFQDFIRQLNALEGVDGTTLVWVMLHGHLLVGFLDIIGARVSRNPEIFIEFVFRHGYIM